MWRELSTVARDEPPAILPFSGVLRSRGLSGECKPLDLWGDYHSTMHATSDQRRIRELCKLFQRQRLGAALGIDAECLNFYCA
jgi:hypothetical protein